jgi:hypothetical protein
MCVRVAYLLKLDGSEQVEIIVSIYKLSSYQMLISKYCLFHRSNFINRNLLKMTTSPNSNMADFRAVLSKSKYIVALTGSISFKICFKTTSIM